MPRTSKMLDIEDINKEVTPETLNLPATPKVRQIIVEEFVDSTDAEELSAAILLDDQTVAEDKTWERVEPIKWAVKDKIEQLGDPRFVYVKFYTESEYANRFSGEED